MGAFSFPVNQKLVEQLDVCGSDLVVDGYKAYCTGYRLIPLMDVNHVVVVTLGGNRSPLRIPVREILAPVPLGNEWVVADSNGVNHLFSFSSFVAP